MIGIIIVLILVSIFIAQYTIYTAGVDSLHQHVRDLQARVKQLESEPRRAEDKK